MLFLTCPSWHTCVLQFFANTHISITAALTVRFFAEREYHARKLFAYACFYAVNRPADHPRRSTEYMPSDRFWEKRGYQRQSQLKANFAWQDLDEDQESEKSMTFWMKSLT